MTDIYKWSSLTRYFPSVNWRLGLYFWMKAKDVDQNVQCLAN